MADVDADAYAALGLAFEDAPSEATIKKVRRARATRAARDARRRATRAGRRFRDFALASKRRLTTTATTTTRRSDAGVPEARAEVPPR